MGNYKSVIRSLQSNIDAERQEIGSEYKNIGKYLFTEGMESTENPVQETNFASGKEIKSDIQELDDTIDEINTVTEQQQNFRNQIKTNISSIKALKTQNREYYEQIGEAAYEAYKRNPFIDKRYKDLFLELEQNHQELKEMENDIDRNEQNIAEKPFFNKMMKRGKLFLLKNKRTSKVNAIPRFYKNIGEQICESDFLDSTENELIKNTAQPCIDRRKSIRELENKNDKLENEIASLDEELSTLCSGNRPDREINRLKKEKQDKENQLEGVYESIGIAFVSKPEEKLSNDPNVTKPLTKIRSIEENIRKEDEKITKLSAAIRVEELCSSINKLEDSIIAKENQITQLTDEINKTKEQLVDAQREKEQFESIRGPEESLQ
jgi:chromosome segregation ATPase